MPRSSAAPFYAHSRSGGGPGTAKRPVRLVAKASALRVFSAVLLACVLTLTAQQFYSQKSPAPALLAKSPVTGPLTRGEGPDVSSELEHETQPAEPEPLPVVVDSVESPAASYGRAPQAGRIGRASSIDELRSFCAAEAPELVSASWTLTTGRNITAGVPYPHLVFDIETAPVCFTPNGIVLVDPARFDSGLSALRARWGDGRVKRLDDGHFLHNDGTRGHAAVVPAMAIVPYGIWIATHLWHMLTDILKHVMQFMQTYNRGEMWSVPTQGVLLQDAGGGWVDRYNDTVRKMQLSTEALNLFSSPRTGGPFFPSAPVMTILPSERPAPEPAKGQPLLQCYCQAMPMDRLHPLLADHEDMYYAIQDLAVGQFGGESYLGDYSLAEIETRRLSAHPWAGQFWRPDAVGPAFDAATGAYRPRAVVVHRQTRVIANVSVYVAHLKGLGFRVEEVYPERLTVPQQYHLGRYADLYMAMHGLGMGHAMWMNRYPQGCRTGVEFVHWAHARSTAALLRVMGVVMKFRYERPEAIDVTFGPSVANLVKERAKLRDPKLGGASYLYPGFTDQTAFFNETELRALFADVKANLDECLPRTQFAGKQSTVPSLADVLADLKR